MVLSPLFTLNLIIPLPTIPLPTRAMTYRVKRNHCYLVPCYKHQIVRFAEPEVDDDLSSESNFMPSPTNPSTILPDLTSNDTEVHHEARVEDHPQVIAPSLESVPNDPVVDETPEARPAPVPPDPPRRSQRETRRPQYLQDYSC